MVQNSIVAKFTFNILLLINGSITICCRNCESTIVSFPYCVCRTVHFNYIDIGNLLFIYGVFIHIYTIIIIPKKFNIVPNEVYVLVVIKIIKLFQLFLLCAKNLFWKLWIESWITYILCCCERMFSENFSCHEQYKLISK